MITKRNGNGQTECRGCKEKDKFALTWDCFLYNFNDEPYCFNCLMEKLEKYQQRIDKAIDLINYYGVEPEYNDNTVLRSILKRLLEILKESEDDED